MFPERAHIFISTQVMGAAVAYKEMFADDVALKVAVLTKLTRNLFLALAVPGIAWHTARQLEGGGGGKVKLTAALVAKYVPLFVVGFAGTELEITNQELEIGLTSCR
jgi:uncharacterized membrane protein YadS